MKRTRKPSASQVDPKIKAIAKQLKASGVLSSRANLRRKAISRHVVNKVRDFEWVAKNNYKAVKVKPALAQAAKAQGLEVIGNRIIVPKDGRSTKRLQENILTGIRSIPGGNMRIVQLPYASMTEFLKALRRGDVERFRRTDEQFAFTFYGNKSTQAFRDSKHLLEWLLKYDSITNPITGALLSDLDKTYSNFVLYTVLANTWNPPSFEERRRNRIARRAANRARGDETYTKRRYKKNEELSAYALNKRLETNVLKKRKQRSKMSDAERAEYSRRGAERVKKSRANKRKPK